MAYSPNEDLVAGTTAVPGGGGDEIEAYRASPTAPGRRGGVVVIHHLPGYDSATKEITRRFAVLGYDAICPNLYSREAPGADPDDASATVRALGGVPDERLVADVAGAAAWLRALPSSNGRVAVIGYCSGGRQAFLSAVSLDLQAAVDCYGAFVVGTPPETFPLRVTPLLDRTSQLSCPLLGLFGREDSYPSPEQVEELAQALRDNGKEHEFHVFDDAGHAFFAVDRPGYRQAAATQGWRLIADFFDRHLS
ncbi:dienelactone hydrolase family protein [Angustibacter sp. McL0619]|uniref:dienelactone hydrolase family protein n=1 Tax=Angustibacter sp. McL0619 TaxID=3415676 RepID=UPI003CF26A88